MPARFRIAEATGIWALALLLASCAGEQMSDTERTWADGPPPPGEVERVTTAAMYGQTTTVRRLIEEGKSPNAAYEENGVTALMLAARMGHADVVDVLLRAGATADATGDRGTTALMEAASRGHAAIVERLLKAGARPNRERGKAGRPLLAATVGGYDEVVDVLLEAGAEPNFENPHGWTPLESAEHQGNAQIAARLRKAGATQ